MEVRDHCRGEENRGVKRGEPFFLEIVKGGVGFEERRWDGAHMGPGGCLRGALNILFRG